MALTVIKQGSSWSDFTNYQSYMTQVGNGLPEGTPCEIDFTFVSSWLLGSGADLINNRLSSQGVTPWPGTSTYATVSGNTIVLRWVKESLFLDLIFLAMTAFLGIVGFSYVKNWIFGSAQSVSSGGGVIGTGGSNGNNGNSGTSILGTANLWAWAIVAVAGFAVVRQMIAAKEDARHFGL